MPTYTIQADSGRTYDLEAPDPVSAAHAVVYAESQRGSYGGGAHAPSGGTHSTGEDVVRGGVGGVIRGAAGDAGIAGDIRQGVGTFLMEHVAAPAVRIAARVGGASDAQARGIGEEVRRDAPHIVSASRTMTTLGRHGGGKLPTTSELLAPDQIAGRAGGAYVPQTGAGHFAQTVGENAQGALVPGGPIARIATVVAPAIGSEVSGAVAEHSGASPDGVGIARTVGGVVGGLAAGGGPTAASLIRNAAGRGAVDMAAAGQAVDAELARLNIRRADLPTGANARIEELIQNGARPEAAVNHALAETLPQPVPISRGQASGVPSEQAIENSAGRGANGPAASALVQGQKAAATTAIRGNADTIASHLAGGAAPSPVEAGAAVSDRLNTMRDTAHTGVNAAYDAARAAGPESTLIPRPDIPRLSDTLHTSVDTFDPVRVPSVYREIGRFNGATDVTAEDLFRTRSVLSNLAASSDSVEAAAAGRARRSLDGFIDDAVSRDLFTGNPDAVARWRAAIGQRRAFGQLFEGNDLIDRLTAREPRGGSMQLSVAPEDAANYILGRSGLGVVGRRNLVRDMGRLRDTLGASSDQWNGLRSAVFQRLVQTGEGPAGTGAFSGQNFANAWRDANARDPQMMSLIFSANERGTISRLAAVAQRVTTPVPGGFNPSSTATVAAILSRARPLIAHIPLLREVVSFVGDAADAARVRGMVVNPRPSQGAPRLPAPVPRLSATPVLAGLANGSIGARSAPQPSR